MLTHLDLFSGIGGFALACEWAGIKTIGFVEIDKYCQNVLRKHWPAVPIVEDIRDVGKIKEIIANTQCVIRSRQAEGEVNRQGYGRDGTRTSLLQTTEQGEWGQSHQPVTLITGGFPCQPFSVAGKRGGMEDDRYLWPEMLNVIKEIMPRWVLGENVAGIVRMELDTCLSDLERIGYTTQAFIIPACAVNAPHRRDRVWIVGYTSSDGQPNTKARNRIEPRNQRSKKGQNQLCQPERASCVWEADVADIQYTQTSRQRRYGREILRNTESEGLNITSGKEWWAVEPELGRVAHGVSNRVDRLKALGNAIVPQVAYQIIKRIAQIEDTSRSCTG